MDTDTCKLPNYRKLIRKPKYKKNWSMSSANEIGCLANGVGRRIKNPTNTITFIIWKDIPNNRKKDVIYGKFICSVRPDKKENNRTRFSVGGDQIDYPGEVATPTTDILVSKILFNSVISTNGYRFMTIDISNFCLVNPLKQPE